MERALIERLTSEDYRAMPAGPPYFQLVEGEIVMSPSPNLEHQRVARRIFRMLDAFVQRHCLGEVFFAPIDVFLDGNNVLQPDVLFVGQARRAILAPEGVRGAPDLVVEILSPAHGLLDLRRKRPVYARSGVAEQWLVNPDLRQLHRYDFAASTAKPVQLLDAGEAFETPLLPGLRIELAEIFAG